VAARQRIPSLRHDRPFQVEVVHATALEAKAAS